MRLLLLFLFLSGSNLLISQEEAILESSDLSDQVKIERNIGFSLGYNPFPQELLVNLEFRATKRFSPFIGVDIGYDDIRSAPMAIGTSPSGMTIYQVPTVVDEATYYQLTLGSRVTFGERTGNYSGLCLDFGIQAKLAGDEFEDYYGLISRIGYRLFFTSRLYFLTGMQFDFAYSNDSWNPENTIHLVPDFDVDLLNVRVGYQF